jgi:hypothetical protein
MYENEVYEYKEAVEMEYGRQFTTTSPKASD